MKILAIAVMGAALALAGCAADGLPRSVDVAARPSPNQTPQPAIGGITGGGLIMRELGADLGRRERLAAIDAEYRALETAPAGQPVTWQGGGNGRSGTVTAAQPYRVGSQDCRPYSHSVIAGGTTRTARGTACRNADGSWTLLD
ncbi:RT0821/Lpp0805 family surface protein [Chelativorans sp.]|uniref:RT0821/Lpp0805 family surface protein n=1 Tax=Chelativorans sp. TaxID=2203393 RepID=UPI0028121D27|nr:RT0821/Lpp0805 family surface protein [Chelativorans sp.]